MSIENMTNVSHFLLDAAVLTTVAAVVMFFALDISKCWKMVYGKAVMPKKRPSVNKHQKESKKTQNISEPEFDEGREVTLFLDREADGEYWPVRQTLPLSDVTGAGYEANMKTVLLHDEEETLPLSYTGAENAALPVIKDLELIQDIVYTQGESREIS